jgi:hypothetical protein
MMSKDSATLISEPWLPGAFPVRDDPAGVVGQLDRAIPVTPVNVYWIARLNRAMTAHWVQLGQETIQLLFTI